MKGHVGESGPDIRVYCTVIALFFYYYLIYKGGEVAVEVHRISRKPMNERHVEIMLGYCNWAGMMAT